MTPERRKLKRAQLIQRIRSVERMQSAAAASAAEANRTRLVGVAQRTRDLAAQYADREGESDGANLRSGKAMSDQLRKLMELSEKQVEEAQLQSQASREVLAQSEIRLRKAKESSRDLARAIIERLEKS